MIGKMIFNMLGGSGLVTEFVPAERIFPYFVSENTPLPAIVYAVKSVEPEYSKDGWEADITVFTVSCIANDYGQLQEISWEVRKCLELARGTVDCGTKKIYMIGQDEAYHVEADVFINRLTFNTQVYDYQTE